MVWQMGLSEIKKSIEQDSKSYFEAERQNAIAEQKLVLEEARKKAEEIIRDAKEAAKRKQAILLAEAEAEVDVEYKSIISSAMDSFVSKNLAHFRSDAIKEFSSKHQKELILSAIASFSELVPKDKAIIEISKKNADLAKGFGKKKISNIEGVSLSSEDESITLIAGSSELIDSNLDKLKSSIARNLFEI